MPFPRRGFLLFALASPKKSVNAEGIASRKVQLADVSPNIRSLKGYRVPTSLVCPPSLDSRCSADGAFRPFLPFG
jgi:hypothetical protein